MTPLHINTGKAQGDLPPISGKESNKKIGSRPLIRKSAKSAAVGQSSKLKKQDDGQLEQITEKGIKFIQKMSERQKRMEERYFKKDINPKQDSRSV